MQEGLKKKEKENAVKEQKCRHRNVLRVAGGRNAEFGVHIQHLRGTQRFKAKATCSTPS